MTFIRYLFYFGHAAQTTSAIISHANTVKAAIVKQFLQRGGMVIN